MMKRIVTTFALVLFAIPLALAAVPQATSAPQQQPAPPAPQQAPAVQPAPSIEPDDLLKPPPLPPGYPSLVGGTVSKIDRVRQAVMVRPFGGQNLKIYFDERTHIYRDGIETTMLGIRKGDRVYVDTLLDGGRVFAKNIRVQTESHPADARGQIVAYDAKDARMEMRDELSAQPVTFRINPDTVVRHGDQKGSLADLQPGALVDVRFSPERAGQGVAREITVIAKPGSEFVFAGKVTHLNLAKGVLAMQNRTDNKSYEIHFDPGTGHYDNLGVGSEISAQAVFDGSQYVARNITVTQAKAE
jgi:hypothetical protein